MSSQGPNTPSAADIRIRQNRHHMYVVSQRQMYNIATTMSYLSSLIEVEREIEEEAASLTTSCQAVEVSGYIIAIPRDPDNRLTSLMRTKDILEASIDSIYTDSGAPLGTQPVTHPGSRGDGARTRPTIPELEAWLARLSLQMVCLRAYATYMASSLRQA